MSTENLSTIENKDVDQSKTPQDPLIEDLIKETAAIVKKINNPALRTPDKKNNLSPIDSLQKKSQDIVDKFFETPKSQLGSAEKVIASNIEKICAFLSPTIQTIDVISRSENEKYGLPHQPEESFLD